AKDRVRRAAQLERTDRLQILELEPHLVRRVDLKTDQRGANSRRRDPFPRFANVLERRGFNAHQNSLMGSAARAAELNLDAGVRAQRFRIEEMRRCEILD